MKPSLHIVVPVLNEKENVAPLLNGLREFQQALCDEFCVQVLIVDDGSTDETADVLNREAGGLALDVLSHSVNRGPGAAFGTAFEHLAEKLGKEDWIVTMEGDNTSRTETLVQMLKRRQEGYDVVLASPYAYGGGIVGVELNRVVLSHCANALAKTVLGLRGIHTLSSFFRIYSAETLQKLQQRFGSRVLEFSGFESMVELLVKLVSIGATMSEVEMSVDWGRRKGKSKMRRLPAIMGYLRLLAAARKWKRAAGKGYWKPLSSS